MESQARIVQLKLNCSLTPMTLVMPGLSIYTASSFVVKRLDTVANAMPFSPLGENNMIVTRNHTSTELDVSVPEALELIRQLTAVIASALTGNYSSFSTAASVSDDQNATWAPGVVSMTVRNKR